MNTAEQIEFLARQGTDRLGVLSREFTAAQDRLAGDLTAHRQQRHDADAHLRDELAAQADAVDSATPRIMLPADQAQASPHHPEHGKHHR